jgi:hypothetical protein
MSAVLLTTGPLARRIHERQANGRPRHTQLTTDTSPTATSAPKRKSMFAIKTSAWVTGSATRRAFAKQSKVLPGFSAFDAAHVCRRGSVACGDVFARAGRREDQDPCNAMRAENRPRVASGTDTTVAKLGEAAGPQPALVGSTPIHLRPETLSERTRLRAGLRTCYRCHVLEPFEEVSRRGSRRSQAFASRPISSTATVAG